jgi:two-component system copper resistance phosphate regulon response regulator CusR
MKILVVEDEPKTGDYLKQGLIEAGFVTDLAQNGREGVELAKGAGYDLLILDVMLPGLSGWQILEGVRRAGLDVPVLFLTARDQVADRVKGLELGADDYLIKPFAFVELFVRRKGEVLPRSLIASHVWGINFDSHTNVVDVAVRRLRVKIDEGHDLKLIRTVRGMGYMVEETGEGPAL